tara:strand:- start:340 stop:711 length:372 start_codon:yes stop_codon:yes gene_type:complete
MNLFTLYLKEIKNKLIDKKNNFNLNNKSDLSQIIVENPPEKFDFDLSSNAAMIIAKNTNSNPREIAKKLSEILLNEVKDFSIIDIAGPGFLNIKLSNHAWVKTINSIYKNKKFGSTNQKKNIT